MTDEGNVNPERLKEMKGAIHQFLSQANVYSSIRDIVDSYVADSEGAAINPEDPAEIVKIIKEKGILQSLLSRLRNEAGITATNGRPQSVELQPAEGEYFLHVRFNGGRAFLDSLTLEASQRRDAKLFTAVQFGSQRFRTTFVNCSVNPELTDDLLFRLDATMFGFGPDELIEVSTPFYLAVFQEDTLYHTSTLIGENMLDWRRVLKTGYLGLTVELCGRSAGVPAGIVDLEMELISPKKIRYSEEVILSRLDQQREAITSADREFLIYARRWWTEYQGLNRKHRERKVKLFASTTTGRMVPVTHFISPIQTSHGLSSPFDALRFVSLMKATDVKGETQLFPVDSGNDAQSWLAPFVFVSQKQGHSCNHAALLCSLLLGFGLDAYCAIGSTPQNDVATFVVVRSRGLSGNPEITVWDPLLGEQLPLNEAHSFATIDCLFNHKSFFASVHPVNSLGTATFELDNDSMWKAVNPLKLRLVPKYPTASLVYTPLMCEEVEASLEMKVRAQIKTHRDSIGQQTSFDNNLCYVLAQALDSYESQRRCGKVEDFALFQQCVKGLLGPGKTFKALPINIANEDDKHVIEVLSTNDAGKEIIDTVAMEEVKFGVRVRVFPFPENVRSVWVMIAVSYRIQP